MAGKAALYGGHDSIPEHAEHNSSGERSNSATHAVGGVGV